MYNVTKDIVLNAEIPQQTRTYKPVTHRELIDLTLNGIEKAGFTLDKELYSSAREGAIANGRFTISNVMDSEMQLEVGWQNSYDKSLSLKFAIGTRIMICQNGCVSGDYGAFKKKHVGEVQLFTPHAISEYIKGAGDVFRRMQDERDRMKQIEVSKRVKAELIGRMIIEEGFIQSTQLNLISKELDNPTFDYGAPDSMWELYQFTTQAMREVHPSLWMNNHIKAHNFFVNEGGVLVAPPQMVDIIEEVDVEEVIGKINQFSTFSL
jgi:hypothetical protein